MDGTLLIQDLLSPSNTILPPQTNPLITYYISNSTPNLLIPLIQSISTSPSLWKGSATSTPAQLLPFNLASAIFNSIRDGIVYRSSHITTTTATGHGWRGRRAYATFFDHYYKGVHAEDDCHPTVRLLLASAALAALQTIKLRKDKLSVGGSALMGRAEKELLDVWDEFFETPRANEEDIVPPWLAAQTFPLFTIVNLKTGPLASILPYLQKSFSSVFSQGDIFSTLAADLHSTPIHWNIPSSSHTLITSALASPLFVALGPLSRAIGRCIEAMGKQSSSSATIASIKSASDGCQILSKKIHKDWAQSTWSDIENESELDEETRTHTEPWTVLKTLLFAITLIHSSILVVIAPKPGDKITALQKELAEQGLRTLATTYFITIKFGPDGFGAWRGVWSGLMEIAGSGGGKDVEQFLRTLEPKRFGVLHDKVVERSVATYYLNAAEQLMLPLPDEYVEAKVLTGCRPYLENSKYRDPFESAHSVLLAIFSTEKSCSNALAPWYTKLLLQAHPNLMTTSQLRLAFTAMIRCVSATDDALAWYCILQLIAAIKETPSGISTTAVAPPLDLTDPHASLSDSKHDESTTLSPLELSVLTLARGHLLLTLIDQTTSVNLILLKTLLEQIWVLVREEDLDGEGREGLVKVVFQTLGEGLDATKKEEGTKYWMFRGDELVG